MINNRLFYKTLSAVMLVQLIVLILIIIFSPKVSGYELNIYNSVPLLFWILLVNIIIIAFFQMYYFTFIKYISMSWLFPFIILLSIKIIILTFPFFRGYYFIAGPNSDIFSHIGIIRDIQNSGFIENNFYPITHILVLTLSNILNTSVSNIAKLIPTFFSFLYSLSLFILGKSISSNKLALILSSFSFIFMFSTFNWSFHPSFFSFFIIPFLLYSYYKVLNSIKIIEYILICIIFSILIVFFHPITTIILIIMFLIFLTGNLLSTKLFKFNEFSNKNGTILHTVFIFLLLTISFITWITSMPSGVYSIKNIISGIFKSGEPTIVSNYVGIYLTAGLTTLQSIRFIFLNYGIIILLSTISLIFFINLFIKILRRKNFDSIYFIYSIQLIGGLIYSLYFILFSSYILKPIRSIQYFLLVTIIFNSLMMLKYFKKSKITKTLINTKFRNSSTIILTMILFIFLITLSIFILYPSPIIYSGNSQYTYKTLSGSSWVVINSNTNYNYSSDVGFNYERMDHYLNGLKSNSSTSFIETMYTTSNFGYNQNSTIFETYNYSKTYLISTKQGLVAVEAYPDNVKYLIRQWNKEAINKLENDGTVIQIYCNSEFNSFLVG